MPKPNTPAPGRADIEELIALHGAGRLRDVERKARKLAKRHPDMPVIFELLGSALAGQGKTGDAVACFQRIAKLAPGNPDAHYNLALALQQTGRFEAAVASYRKSLELRPDNAVAHGNLGTALMGLDKPQEALAQYKEALAADPGATGAHFGMGLAFRRLVRLDEAITSFRAAAAEPGNADAHCHLGELYELTNRIDLAEEHTDQCLRLDPGNARAILVKATVLRRRGRPEEAIAMLEPLVSGPLPFPLDVRAHNELGHAYDRLHETDMAYTHFLKANEAHAASAAAAPIDKNVFLRDVRRIRETLTEAWLESWPLTGEGELSGNPAFVVGFPRSGTTLLDQILDAHPNIQVMEEPTIFMDLLREITPDVSRYPAVLAELDSAKLDALRASYFREAEKYATPKEGALLIEKNPLNICHLPFIVRLFPQARIVHCLRHPCDVVLSSFMQFFDLSPAMANFLTLEDTVRSYAQVMGLWRQCEELVPMNVHTLRYEALVADFAGEISDLLEFLGLDWDDAVRDFARHAKGRQLRTASYQAVTEGLNTRSQDRWKRYGDKLAPFMDELRPFIEAFGYSESAGK